jgi:hypothetical protein
MKSDTSKKQTTYEKKRCDDDNEKSKKKSCEKKMGLSHVRFEEIRTFDLSF